VRIYKRALILIVIISYHIHYSYYYYPIWISVYYPIYIGYSLCERTLFVSYWSPQEGLKKAEATSLIRITNVIEDTQPMIELTIEFIKPT
jgi:hypothetical protein